MIEQEATVTRLDNNQAWIKRLHSAGCSGCRQQSDCGTSVLSNLLPKREFAVANDNAVKVGDTVIVAIDDRHLLLGSFLLYLLPIVSMLLGVLVTNYLLPLGLADTWLPIVALSILIITFKLIKRFQSYFLFYFQMKPQITGKD